MGGSLWDQLGLPLLIGLAIQAGVAALWFLSVRLWNWLTIQIETGATAVAERADGNQPLPENDNASAHAIGVPDLETGNGSGPAEGGESMADPELELGIVNGGGALDRISQRSRGPHSSDRISFDQRLLIEDSGNRERSSMLAMIAAPLLKHSLDRYLYSLGVQLLLILRHVNPNDPTSLSYTGTVLEVLSQ